MKAMEIISKYIEEKEKIDPEIKKNYEERKLTPESVYEMVKEYAESVRNGENCVMLDDKTVFALIDCIIETGSKENFTPPVSSEEDLGLYDLGLYLEKKYEKEVKLSDEELKKIEKETREKVTQKKIEEARKKALEKERKAFEKEENKKQEVGQLSLFDL